MLYDCSAEFDLEKIYQKLVGDNPERKESTRTVCANKFFERNELELLQKKLNSMSDRNLANYVDTNRT